MTPSVPSSTRVPQIPQTDGQSMVCPNCGLHRPAGRIALPPIGYVGNWTSTCASCGWVYTAALHGSDNHAPGGQGTYPNIARRAF